MSSCSLPAASQSSQLQTAKQWLSDKDESFLPLIILFQAREAPYPASLFNKSATSMKPVTWWKGLSASSKIPDNFICLMIQLPSACASSSSIERGFSSFGLTTQLTWCRHSAEVSLLLQDVRGAEEYDY